jgi:hypothetical protein
MNSNQSVFDGNDDCDDASIFETALRVRGTYRYGMPTPDMTVDQRLRRWTTDVEESLVNMLRSERGRAWLGGYAIIVEFENGNIDFIEVGSGEPAKQLHGLPELTAYVSSTPEVRYWQGYVDAVRAAAAEVTGEDTPWRSIVVVYAARIGDEPYVASTRVAPDATGQLVYIEAAEKPHEFFDWEETEIALD